MHKGFFGDCMDQLNAKLGEISNWIPGYINDKPVCIQMELDIARLLNETKEK